MFDVLIVGSGFGGGTVAYALSRAGLKVLLVERGGWPARDETDWNGRAILLDGRYRGETPLGVRQSGAATEVDTFPNEVVGGNSIFFGGAALRLRATDFARWPITYADLEPHYAQAESLLEVHGRAGDDPCEPPRSGDYPYAPAPLSAPARRIAEAARALGMHPFHIPIAINHAGAREPKCINCFTCDGFPCRIGAKNDVTQTALAKADPANLAVVARVLAARVVERDGRIVALEAIDSRDGGRRLTLRARLFVLSGGAIGSAALMLRSGLAARDASGTLGRYLMRHCNAMMGYLFPFRDQPRTRQSQADLHHRSTTNRCATPTAPRWASSRTCACRRARWCARWARAAFAGRRPCRRERIQTLLCIAEDDAQADNAVTLSATARTRSICRSRTCATNTRRPTRAAATRSCARRANPEAGGGPGRQGAAHRQLLARRGDGPDGRHARGRRAVSGMPASGHSPTCSSSTAASCRRRAA